MKQQLHDALATLAGTFLFLVACLCAFVTTIVVVFVLTHLPESMNEVVAPLFGSAIVGGIGFLCAAGAREIHRDLKVQRVAKRRGFDVLPPR